MDNQNKGDNNKKSNVVVIVIAIVLALLLCQCMGVFDSSSSGKKWSDLTETEKNNARWAYEVQQGLKD